MIAQWWDKVLAGFAHGTPLAASPLILALMVLAAAALSVPRATWRYFGLFVTLVHELGHAFAALMTGQRISGIRLHFNHSGTMVSRSRGRLRTVWSGFWGYPVPAVVGAALVWAAYNGWAGFALSASALVLLLSLLFIRNLQGVAIALGCAAVAVLLVWFAADTAVGYICVAVGVALLVGAVRDWLNVLSVHTRRRQDVGTSDAYILFRRTRVPSFLWLAGFALVIAAACTAAIAVIGSAARL